MTGYNDTDPWGRDPLDADYMKPPASEAVKPMTSSTPSPSAQELAAENESHVATHRDGQSDPCDCWLCDLLRRNAAALRRLAGSTKEGE